MSTAELYCSLHGYGTCQCYAALSMLRLEVAGDTHRPSNSHSEYSRTASQSRTSPKGSSSSSTFPSTEATRAVTIAVAGSAFSPLALCFRNGPDNETDDQAPGVELPLAMHNGAQNRLQLLQRFYDLHLGASSHARAIFQYEAIGAGCIGRATTTSAMDTLCVAQVATSFDDPQMMVESKRMYGQTMTLLATKIRAVGESTPSPDQLDDIIGTIHALTASSWFRCVGAGALDWTRHAQALLRVLKVFGWAAMSPTTRKAFRYNWKYRAFWDGISRRVRVHYRDPETESTPRDLSSALLELGFNTCELLARSDDFLASSQHKPPREMQVTTFLTEIGALVALLKKWHLAWTKMPPSRSRQRIVSTRYFNAFRTVSKEHFGVFPTASDFSRTADERDFRILNICLLNLDEAIIDLHAAFPEYCSSPEMQLQLRAAEYDAATCAAELCMVVPWSSQPSNMAFACIHAMQPLQYASKHYRKHGKILQLEWCQRVTETLCGKYGIRVQLWEESDAFVNC